MTPPTNQPPTDSPPGPRPRLLWPVLLVPGLFLAAALPVILSGNLSGRGAYDQLLFHEPMIRQFVREWPRFDFGDYLSATTPGYHLLLTAWARFIDPSRAALQLAGSIFTVGLLASLTAATVRRARANATALACILPAAASMYILFPGIWLLPDNIGWWLVLAVLLIALRPWTLWSPFWAGAALLALVFVRQSHLWAAGIVWAAAWVSTGRFNPGPSAAGEHTSASPLTEIRWLFTNLVPRAGALAVAFTATIPALLIVLAFYQLWGGLVVPRFQSMYHGLSPAAPAFILSNLAIVSAFYAGFLLPPLVHAWKHQRTLVIIAATAGLLAALLPPTTYDYDHGRSSGLWNIVKALPVLGGRTSLLILILAPAGAVAAAGWLAAVSRRERWVFLAALSGFTAAQTASPLLWQRYSEPMVLILVALWAATASRLAPPTGPGPLDGLARLASRLRLAGPVLLALLFAALSARTISTAQPVKPEESPQYVAPAAP